MAGSINKLFVKVSSANAAAAKAASANDKKIYFCANGEIYVNGVAYGQDSDEFAKIVAQVEANKSAIEVLNGGSDVEGSVAKAVSDAIANIVDADGGTIDKLQEVITWFNGLATDDANTADKVIADIAANGAAITVLNGDATTAGSVAKAVADAKAEVEEEIDALDERVSELEAAKHAVSDVTTTEGKRISAVHVDEKGALTIDEVAIADVEKEASDDASVVTVGVATKAGVLDSVSVDVELATVAYANGDVTVEGSDKLVQGSAIEALKQYIDEYDFWSEYEG
jgi:hypothetical protein